MTEPGQGEFYNRVVQAAEAVLERDGSVGLLELFQHMSVLPRVHVEQWRKGNERFRVIEKSILLGEKKRARAIQIFDEWVRAKNLRPIEASYSRRTPHGIEPLQITADDVPERERFYRTHFTSADLSAKKAAQVEAKLNKAPDLVVFEKVSEDGNCAECGAELLPGALLFMDKGQPLCLGCADLDHLVFLPAGDTALSRRSRKYSPLSAVVVRFNRRRKRYERQGLLVSEQALAQAEAECVADAPDRAAARARAAVARVGEDREFCDEFTRAIAVKYPACPADEARRIAEHAALRGSGRVGRSAAARKLDPAAIDLAVIAHIRHEHTRYDELLMQGIERLEARERIRADIDRVLARWRNPL